jgi:hypothetical protein
MRMDFSRTLRLTVDKGASGTHLDHSKLRENCYRKEVKLILAWSFSWNSVANWKIRRFVTSERKLSIMKALYYYEP